MRAPLPRSLRNAFWNISDHPAYRALNPTERCLVVEFVRLAHRIGTDEPITFSVRMAADACNVPKSVAARALSSLREKGFIAIERPGSHYVGGFASGWRITFLPYQSQPPTHDYNRLHWKARDQRAQAPMEHSPSNAASRTADEENLRESRTDGRSQRPLICPPRGTPFGQVIDFIGGDSCEPVIFDGAGCPPGGTPLSPWRDTIYGSEAGERFGYERK
jgi:hypothetical protein